MPKLTDAALSRLQQHFNIALPSGLGYDTLACINAAHEGRMRVAMHLGGNLFASNPDAVFAAKALQSLDMTVFLSTTLNTGHIVGRGRESIILPVLPRDEEHQPTTQESMFNFVRLSDGGEARHRGPRSEVDVIADIAENITGHANIPAVDWQALRQHDTIRRAIAAVVPGYERISNISATGGEFHIDGRTFHQPRFNTDDGKAVFHAVAIPDTSPAKGDLRLMTIRSEGQFNTVVYEEADTYRNQERRDVILMSRADMQARHLQHNDRVSVLNATGALHNILAREFDIPPGNAAMYYPEANVLVPRQIDGRSRTPAFKNIAVRVELCA
ncbi:MAG: molybdopterin dinucleotide binding domain-containing protein [Phycisphaerales bacterium]